MARLEFWLFAGALTGLVLGIVAVLRTRASWHTARTSWGPHLFVATLMGLGGASLIAAFHRADGLVPLGLSAGFLVVALFVESPRSEPKEMPTMTAAEDY